MSPFFQRTSIFNQTRSLLSRNAFPLTFFSATRFSTSLAMGLLTLSLSILPAIPHLVSATGYTTSPRDQISDTVNSTKGWRWEKVPNDNIVVEADKFNGLETEVERTTYELLKQSHCLSSGRGFVHFEDTSAEDGLRYVISTPWTASYDLHLQHEFNTGRWWLWKRPTPEQSCGWLYIDSVKHKGVFRGKFYYKHKIDPMYTIGNPSDLGYPNGGTIHSIQAVLEETFPAAEIALILCFSLGPIVVLAACLAWRGVSTLRRRRRGVQEGQKADSNEGFELVNTRKRGETSDVAGEEDTSSLDKQGGLVTTAREFC